MHAPLRGPAQSRCDRGRLQPVERRLEAVIVAHRSATAHEGEAWGGYSRDLRKLVSRASTSWDAAQISRSASQIGAMPCSAVASTRIATHAEIDRGHTV